MNIYKLNRTELLRRYESSIVNIAIRTWRTMEYKDIPDKIDQKEYKYLTRGRRPPGFLLIKRKEVNKMKAKEIIEEYHAGDISPMDLAKKYHVGIIYVMALIFRERFTQ